MFHHRKAVQSYEYVVMHNVPSIFKFKRDAKVRRIPKEPKCTFQMPKKDIQEDHQHYKGITNELLKKLIK